MELRRDGISSTLCIEGQGDPDTHVVNYPPGNNLYSFLYLVRE